MPDSEDKNIITQQSINDPIIPDTKLAKPGKPSFEHRIGFRFREERFFYSVKNATNVLFRKFLQVTLDRLFVDDIISQGTSSVCCLKQ